MSTPRQRRFFDLAPRYAPLSHDGDPLESLTAHVPWAEFRPTWNEWSAAPSASKAGGPFNAVLMFKILVLQVLYNLSDEQTGSQVSDRLSYMRFVGLDLD